jgi:hypothetical protein
LNYAKSAGARTEEWGNHAPYDEQIVQQVVCTIAVEHATLLDKVKDGRIPLIMPMMIVGP